MCRHATEPFTVALLTPIMQRAHQLSSAAEETFVDSTAFCDAKNHVITFVLVTSPYGAVPAGVVITAGQSLQNYTAGFRELSNLIPDSSFGGRGHPYVFITDDSAVEHAALEAVWPAAMQRLCHFHVMQAVSAQTTCACALTKRLTLACCMLLRLQNMVIRKS